MLEYLELSKHWSTLGSADSGCPIVARFLVEDGELAAQAFSQSLEQLQSLFSAEQPSHAVDCTRIFSVEVVMQQLPNLDTI